MTTGRLASLFRGQGLGIRALRGASLTMLGFGGMQAIRLASNLILTRLLFPDVFGIMALVMVIIQGVNNFSDVGITPAILQSRRGDDPRFLDTAFTMQAIRGLGLWIACCALALPVAQFYGVPELAWYLPVAGFTAVIHGLLPTRIETANRHLQLGRLTLVELATALVSTAISVGLAAAMGTAWALVIGLVLGAFVKLAMTWQLLPGTPNRFHWDRAAAAELIRFGKWIFPSTIVGFAIAQGDKAILGKYLTLEQLGIYNIAFFLASFPLSLGIAVMSRVMIPVYRGAAEAEDPRAAARRVRRVRAVLTGGLLLMVLVMALLGPTLVNLLYDDRYAGAGQILRAIACATIPALIGLSYDQSALSAGDTRGFFWLALLRAVLFLGLFLTGVHYAGIPGALAGQALATVLAYPMLAHIARRHGFWDPLHDAGFAILGLAMALALLLG